MRTSIATIHASRTFRFLVLTVCAMAQVSEAAQGPSAEEISRLVTEANTRATEEVKEQVARLMSPSPLVGVDAIKTLVRMRLKAESTVRTLIVKLEDRSALIRPCDHRRPYPRWHITVDEEAAWELSLMGSIAIDPLLAKLEDPATTPRARSHALTALGRIPDDVVIAPVARYIQHDDPEVRLAAVAVSISIVFRLVEHRPYPFLSVTLPAQAENLQILADALATVVDDESTEIRLTAVEILIWIGQPAIDSLLRALEDDQKEIRRIAARAVNQSSDRRGVKPMLKLLADEDKDTREYAADFIGAMATMAEIEEIIEAFARLEGFTARRDLSRAFVNIGPAAVEPIMRALTHEDPYVRAIMVSVLPEMIGPKSIQTVVRMLEDPDPAVRNAAIDAARTFYWQGHLEEDPGLPALILNLGSDRDEDLVLAANMVSDKRELMHQRTVGPLIDLLGSDNPKVRRAAVLALGRLDNPAATEPLARRMDDDDRDVSRYAAMALGFAGNTGAVEPLIAHLNDEDIYLAREAAASLGRIGDQRAIGPLAQQLKGKGGHARSDAIRALGELGAIQPLLDALDGGHNQRFKDRPIVLALGRIGDPAALDRLIEILRRNVEPGVAHAIAQIDNSNERALAAMTDLFDSADIKVQSNAITATGCLGNGDAIPALTALLNEGVPTEVQYAAVEALGRTHDPRVVPALIESLQNNVDPGVRRRIAWRLGELADPAAREPLVRAMADPQMRLSAARALSAFGEERAVPALASALLESDSPTEQRQAALSLFHLWTTPPGYTLGSNRAQPPGYDEAKEAMLSRMIDNGAVEAVIDALEQYRGGRNTIYALKRISGKDFGHRPALWREWLVEARR